MLKSQPSNFGCTSAAAFGTTQGKGFRQLLLKTAFKIQEQENHKFKTPPHYGYT